jgi:ribosomal protein L16/L10AE
LSEAHIRTLSNFIRKFYKKKAFAFYKIHYNKQITTKSLGMRMGKGKGSKKKSIYYVGIGNIFLEIGESKTRTQNDFKIFYQMLKKKLPMNIQLISLSNTNSFLRL